MSRGRKAGPQHDLSDALTGEQARQGVALFLRAVERNDAKPDAQQFIADMDALTQRINAMAWETPDITTARNEADA